MTSNNHHADHFIIPDILLLYWRNRCTSSRFWMILGGLWHSQDSASDRVPQNLAVAPIILAVKMAILGLYHVIPCYTTFSDAPISLTPGIPEVGWRSWEMQREVAVPLRALFQGQLSSFVLQSRYAGRCVFCSEQAWHFAIDQLWNALDIFKLEDNRGSMDKWTAHRCSWISTISMPMPFAANDITIKHCQ